MSAACVFCGLTEPQAATGDLAHYGLGTVYGKPVDAVVCQRCPLPLYEQFDPDPDPAVFVLTPSAQYGGAFLEMTRKPG